MNVKKSSAPLQQIHLQSSMGQRIKAAQRAKDLTAERLAELCYMNATYLRHIEAGRRLPSLSVFIRLCNVLEVSPTYLLADFLNANELSDFEVLSSLWKSASPHQVEIITAMVQSALKHV